MHTPVNPNSTIQKWGVSGSTLHGYVGIMKNVTTYAYPYEPQFYNIKILFDWSVIVNHVNHERII